MRVISTATRKGLAAGAGAAPHTAHRRHHPRTRPTANQVLQAKLRVGAANDPLEREADAAAEAALAGEPVRIAGGAPSASQRKCAECEAQAQTVRRRPVGPAEEELFQRRAQGQDASPAGSRPNAVERAAGAARAAGEPMPDPVRRYFEPRFGRDFSQVRVHTDAGAAGAAAAIGARAFTLGRDVVFGAGQYAPGTREGRRVLAHELAHVTQQAGSGARVQRLTQAQKAQDLSSERYAGNARLERAFDNDPPLGIGESGEAVRRVQEGLVEDGFLMPRSTRADGTLDGEFGSETHASVRAFQARHGLSVDGRVGRETLGQLDRLASGPQTQPPGKLPACPDGGEAAGAFASPAGTVPLAFAIPGLTCQLRTSKDKLDLARVRNVKLQVFPQNVNRGWAATGKVYANGEIFAEARADLLPGPSKASQYAFGFVQVCRPFDVVRATYRRLGAAAGTGNDLDWTATMRIREGKKGAGGNVVRPPLPALDVGQGETFSVATPASFKDIKKGSRPKPVETVTPKKGKVPVLTFRDRPQQTFLDRKLKHDQVFQITAFSWKSEFFLAYVVRLPSGTVAPLKTFYWSAEDCASQNVASMIGVEAEKPVGKVKATPVRDCATHHCDRNEPGFQKAGTKPANIERCGAIASAAQKDTPFNGPGNFKLEC